MNVEVEVQFYFWGRTLFHLSKISILPFVSWYLLYPKPKDQYQTLRRGFKDCNGKFERFAGMSGVFDNLFCTVKAESGREQFSLKQ